jgi:hypothetical protein
LTIVKTVGGLGGGGCDKRGNGGFGSGMELDELGDDGLELIMAKIEGVFSELTIGRVGGRDPGRAGESEGGRGEWSFGDIWHLE